MSDSKDYKQLYLEQKSNFLTCRLELLELRFLETKRSLQEVTDELNNHKFTQSAEKPPTPPPPPPPPPKRNIKEGVKIKKDKR